MNDADLNYGPAWLRSMGKTLSPEGERVAVLVNWLFDGIYHVQEDVMRADWSRFYVDLKLYGRSGGLATFDANLLTRLVVGAHDAAIRVEITACSPQYLRVQFHPRARTSSHAYYRHPTIEDHLARLVRLPRYKEADTEEPTPPPPSIA